MVIDIINDHIGCKRLETSTAKGSGTTLCTKFQNKISNNYRCDDQLANSSILLDRLLNIAHIADNSMDFPSVSRVDRRQFADQIF